MNSGENQYCSRWKIDDSTRWRFGRAFWNGSSNRDTLGVAGFSPNAQQRDAIRHTDGPLFLTAGPGSGKTRVLLWRTLNLIVFHGVTPEDIFLGHVHGEGCASSCGRVSRSTLGCHALDRSTLRSLANADRNRPFDLPPHPIGATLLTGSHAARARRIGRRTRPVLSSYSTNGTTSFRRAGFSATGTRRSTSICEVPETPSTARPGTAL